MSAVLIFVLGRVVADVMADVVEVVMCIVVVVLTSGDIKHAAGGLLVGLASIT